MADSVPTYMNAPLPVPLADVNPKSIKLSWDGISSLEDTGRDPVIYYELQWFNYETETWDVLTSPNQTPLLQSAFTFTREIIFPSGSEQRFRLRAQNGVGLGAYSEERFVMAD